MLAFQAFGFLLCLLHLRCLFAFQSVILLLRLLHLRRLFGFQPLILLPRLLRLRFSLLFRMTQGFHMPGQRRGLVKAGLAFALQLGLRRDGRLPGLVQFLLQFGDPCLRFRRLGLASVLQFGGQTGRLLLCGFDLRLSLGQPGFAVVKLCLKVGQLAAAGLIGLAQFLDGVQGLVALSPRGAQR